MILKESSYTLEGTLYRDRPRTGTWTALEGEDGTQVYRLKPSDRTAGLSFMRADGVLLFLDEAGRLRVGNEQFSYTLNRRP